MIYWNGSLLPENKVTISPRDRGWLLGDGLFETLRAEHGQIEYLPAHLARLQRGAMSLGIPLPESLDGIAAGLEATLSANQLESTTAVLRITLTRGPGARGVLPPSPPQPSLLITAEPYATLHLPPAQVFIASQRRNEHSPLSSIKSLNYLENILARMEAGSHDEALMLNSAGNLAGASAANLFIVSNGIILTPPATDGALPGVMGAVVKTTAARAQLPLLEQTLTLDDLYSAQEAFITSSLIRVRPVSHCNERIIGTGMVGDTTRRLQTLIRAES